MISNGAQRCAPSPLCRATHHLVVDLELLVVGRGELDLLLVRSGCAGRCGGGVRHCDVRAYVCRWSADAAFPIFCKCSEDKPAPDAPDRVVLSPSAGTSETGRHQRRHIFTQLNSGVERSLNGLHTPLMYTSQALSLPSCASADIAADLAGGAGTFGKIVIPGLCGCSLY